MNTISRQKTKDERRKNLVKESCRRFLSSLVWILSSVYFAACDFHGPWEYYPEERETYVGIYTYGYVLENGSPYICFSKVYQLDEVSTENFDFYESANVTVEGRFAGSKGNGEISEVTLHSVGNGCFSYYGVRSSYYDFAYKGIAGETYKLNASFKWDSAGQMVTSTYKATATIPNSVKVEGLNIPLQDGSYKWETYKVGKIFAIDFLEYPMDMEFIRVALDYDNSARGVLMILNYGMDNGESPNTTINHLMEGLSKEDSHGYRGVSIHDPLETQQNLGFTSNRVVAGNKMLDTLYLTNMVIPLGSSSIDIYTTDGSYIDYVDKVKQSASDSRVEPESNIENGMGVFFGAAKTSFKIDMGFDEGEYISMFHMADRHCYNEDVNETTRGCRLFVDVICSGMLSNRNMAHLDLVDANKESYKYYLWGDDYEVSKDCYASNVKAAMLLGSSTWSEFLPDTIKPEDKSKAYADGLKRYCVTSGFEDNRIASCGTLKTRCLESKEKNECNTYMWQWCSDRNWDYESFPQCGPALVNRFVVDSLKSSVWEKEVKNWCESPCSEKYSLCEELGYKQENRKECLRIVHVESSVTGVVDSYMSNDLVSVMR